MKRFDAVMFDLDGTLADSLADIAAGGNHVLTAMGLAPLPVPRYRYLAGQGARWLVEEALKTGGPAYQNRVDEGTRLFKEFQLQHAHAYTTLYPGVAEMLDELARRQIVTAVLSNKPDAATQQFCAGHLLSKWKFTTVRGQLPDGPLKPDPTSALAIAKALAIPPDRWLYVGDTRVDMETANNAGMFAVGVLWGFRDEAELRASGAKAIIAHPSELLQLL